MTSACSGVVVLLPSALLLARAPITHILPALVIALISLAYLEEDGVLLSIAILAGLVLLVIAGAAVGKRSTVPFGSAGFGSPRCLNCDVKIL
jgi:hypothetical protein